ncbi:MAG: phosphoribosyltransferase [Candidatus Brockarchaeota archaeon]|nr:phosphoribosyltransferase [Candidatus Brockarchaeota archaeon]
MKKVIDEPAYREKKFVFKDRLQAAEILADKLRECLDIGAGARLLAVPSGGVPVGYAMARKLKVPFDVLVVRKIQVPWNKEAGFGAVTADGDVLLNEELIRNLGLGRETVESSILRTREAVRARVRKFRGDEPFPELKGLDVLVVDDGLASGFTMLAAVNCVRGRSPKNVIVAVPTASRSAVELLANHVDKLVCLNVRSGPFFAVADAYLDWYDLPDEEVMGYLAEIRGRS